MRSLSSPPVRPSRSGRKRAHALDAPRGNHRVGLVGVVVVHVVLAGILFLLPDDWMNAGSASTTDEARSFEIELGSFANPPPLDGERELVEILKTLPPATEKEEPKEPENPERFFISANTQAPENTPDETTIISNQNQQAAQPDATFAGDSPLPTVSAEDPKRGSALVTGTQLRQRDTTVEQFEDFFRKTPHETEAETSPEPKLRVEAAKGAQAETQAGEDEAANATQDGAKGAGAGDATPQDGVEAGRVDGQGYFAKSFKIDRNRPMARPRLKQVSTLPDSAPFVTIKNLDGTSRTGVLSMDARWTEFGDYHGRLRDSVGFEWENNLDNSRILPTRGAVVRVTFVLNYLGEVEEVVEVAGDGNPSTNYLCVTAITNRAPFGRWTQSMIDVLGKKYEMTFTFHF